MANETTTSTADDITNASLVQPYMVKALSEVGGLWRFAKSFDITGQGTAAAKIPVEASWWGSPDDDGAGVDTEFNAAQGTDLSNTAVSTNGVTITTAEYGIAIEPTDNVQEDQVDGLDFLGMVERRMLAVLDLALEDDFLALLAGLSNSVGSSTNDLTVAQLLAATTGIRTRGANADGLVGVLDNQQASDIQGALTATSTSVATFAPAADRIIGFQPSADRGLGMIRQIGSFAGNTALFSTGLTDTANTGADVVGGVFVPSTAVNDNFGHVTFGVAWKRLPRFETERHATKRTTHLVVTGRAGFAELLDGSGTSVITDAP